ncbi:biotin carboxylase [Sinobacterium caligoides]|uniref:Biotin carboxylase n=1 Tax=Sinobacterium caligoides TaxID=933926 RepID=A0A3N2E1I1_9GAMM|nr:ATP-grasp domain-containing protein [Sinobacterium caligoides]ROS05509.1 biotin carboxylase [Sinobacterium caligoides]
MKIILIEPSFFGMGYFTAANKLNIELIVLTNDLSNSDTFGYREHCAEICVVDLNDQDKVFYKVDCLLSRHNVSAVLPGSQLATSIAGIIGERFSLPGLNEQSASLGVNKDFARTAYQKNNVPSAKFTLIDEQTDMANIAEKVPFPMVLKPVASSSSKAVEMIDSSEQLQQRFDALKEVDTSFMGFTNRQLFMVEELLQGDEFSVELALKEGNAFYQSVTEKLKTELPYFVELGHISPAVIDTKLSESLIEVSIAACVALGLSTGVFHVELINTSSGPRIVEVNPRPAGDKIASHLIPLSHNIDLYELHFKMLGEKLPKKPVCDNKVAAVFFMTSGESGKVSKINIPNALAEHRGIVELELYVREGDEVYQPTSSADRIGHFMVKGDSHQVVTDLKNMIEAQIEIVIE